MQCKVCDYRLWNLNSRECPECGTPFIPSDYEFAPNNVAFCCPYCDQSYYGTGPKGHLVPRIFNCVSCGQRIDMDEMVLKPAADLNETETQPERNPWLERKTHGLIKAWFKTIGGAIAWPGRLMLATPQTGRTAEAFGFACLVWALAGLLGFGLTYMPFVLLGIAGTANTSGLSTGVFVLIPFVTVIVGACVIPLVYMLLWGAVTHALLCLTGKRAAGIGRTYEALCYSSGVNAVAAIPCVGALISQFTWIWWSVSATLMVKEGQRVGGLRASFAVLTLPSLLILGFIAWMVAMAVFASTFSLSGPLMISPPSAYSIALEFEASNYQPMGPPSDHALGQIVHASLMYNDLTAPQSNTTLSQIPVTQGMTVARFRHLSLQQQQNILQQATANLPPNNAPYRFGDVVFTYRGLDPQKHPHNLWTAIIYPDPTINAANTPPAAVTVTLFDGTAQTMPYHAFQQDLIKQNLRRQNNNLPLIPDPAKLQQVGGPMPATKPGPTFLPAPGPTPPGSGNPKPSAPPSPIGP